MSDALLSAHDLALVDAIAERVLELLAEREAPSSPTMPQLVDAGELARILGVKRGTIYRHADELGAAPIGEGARARLRFDPQRALKAWTARSGGERSDGAGANGDGASAAPAGRSRPRSAARLPKPGSQLPLKPAPRGRRRSGEQG